MTHNNLKTSGHILQFKDTLTTLEASGQCFWNKLLCAGTLTPS